MPKDRTSITTSSDQLQDVRRVKSFLMLEVNKNVTNEDTISFLIAERVLGTKTVFDLVEGINDIRRCKEEKSGFSEAIREVAELLRTNPQERKPVIDGLEEKYKKITSDSCAENSYKGLGCSGDKKNGFLEGLDAMRDLPRNPLVKEYRSRVER